MATNSTKKSILIDSKIAERFDYLYPRLRSKFCERALMLALNDRALFERIFFDVKFLEVR